MKGVPRTKVWTTRQGVEVKIREMSDSHLLNTIRFLRRTVGPQKNRLAMSMDNHPFGEDTMAAFYTERDAQRLYEMDEDEFISENYEQFGELIAEAERRNLEVSSGRARDARFDDH